MRPQLVHGSGARRIRGDEKGQAITLLKMQGQFAGNGGLAGALKAGEKDDGGWLRDQIDSCRRCAEQADEFAVDDPDHLLTRGQALHDFLAQGAFADPTEELLGDLEVYIGFEQSTPDLA